MKKRILYFGLILLILISCSKDCDTPLDCLPAITMSGEDTFGCLVDGSVLKPAGTGMGVTGLNSYYTNTGFKESLSISAFNKRTKEGVILVITDDVEAGRTYNLGNWSDETYGAFSGDGGFYETFDESSGTVTINYFDLENGIISGVFNFRAKNESGEIVEVTEGRFDVDL